MVKGRQSQISPGKNLLNNNAENLKIQPFDKFSEDLPKLMKIRECRRQTTLSLIKNSTQINARLIFVEVSIVSKVKSIDGA